MTVHLNVYLWHAICWHQLDSHAVNTKSTLSSNADKKKKWRERIQRKKDRKRKDEEDKKQAKTFKDLKTLEVDLDKANKDYLSKRNAIEKLFKQANESLKNALDKHDMDGVRVAEGMLDGVESMEEKAKEAGKKV